SARGSRRRMRCRWRHDGPRRAARGVTAPCPRSRPEAARRPDSPCHSTQAAKPLLKLTAGLREGAHHRNLGTIEHRTALLVGEAVNFAKEYYRSMRGGQLGDGGREPARYLGITGALEGIALLCTVGQERHGIGTAVPALARLRGGDRHLRLPALMVDAQIYSDAIGPGVEAGVALEAIQALKSFREGLLNHVEGVLPISQHPEREGGDLALIAFDQLPEGIPVTLPGSLDELSVARPHGPLAYQTGMANGSSPPGRGHQPGTSAQFGPECASTRRGTLSGHTPSMASRTSDMVRATSASGASRTSSSCTWSSIREWRPPPCKRRDTSSIASLIRSAAEPWMGVLVAARSANWRTAGSRAPSSGR